MKNLEVALKHALFLREELDDTDAQEFDIGHGAIVSGVRNVPRSSLAPRGCQANGAWMERLGAALDILGVGISHDGDHTRLFYREYGTGLLDAAILLRDSFQACTFGPKERVCGSTMQSVAKYLKCRRMRSNPEQILAARLEDIGFATLGERRKIRGTERVIAPLEYLDLELTGTKHLRLAPERQFTGPQPVAGDELLHTHVPGFENYRSEAQRETIHALCDPNGSRVVIARLPTGGGKSLCYLLPAAHAHAEGRPHLAIVVQPIVALQNDQVFQVASKLNARIGANLRVGQINMTVPPEERRKISAQLFRRELHVLFLSPERLLEPFFRETLLALADRQLMGYLVIDEAHIVPEWGRDFRTHYSRLGVVREELLKRCPELRTLILSATLTRCNEKRVLEILRIGTEDCQRITDPHIRRELSLRVEKYHTSDERLQRLLEIAPHLPTPAIIYGNKVKKSVKEIVRRFWDAGIYRCFDYTGSTAAASRVQRLHAFHRGDVRFVVGTNAFGLGLDKENVRSVVHFDVPDSLDACYQEIGRSARDYHTGHAIMLYSPSGMREAVRRSHLLLTSENAWDRARAMLRGRFPKKRGCPVLLPIHALSDGMIANGKSDSTLNREWNLATLNILERQNLVDVRGIVYRNMRVTRPVTRKGLNGNGAVTVAIDVLSAAVGRSKSKAVDLADLAEHYQQDLAALHSGIIMLAQSRAIELEPLDDERGEMWVLGVLSTKDTWSASHMKLLEQLREEDLADNNRALAALRHFFKSPACRLTHFARLYDFEFTKPCGHCDRCMSKLGSK
jgi:superfamily II DNA helicase RecQ